MCGIAGYFAPENSFDDTLLQSMTHCLAHRGPDAEGIFRDGTVGLGHRRLSVIDTSAAANQPMRSHDERWVMIFNGEVFNFPEIAKELSSPLRTHSDTEVILESFSKWGPEAVNRFNGMFVIALYDTKEKCLFLFRDRIGVKPLYYSQQNDQLFFASELKALLTVSHLRSSFQINSEAVALYLQLGYIPQPHTIWQQVKKFPSGHYLKIHSKGEQLHAYWKPESAVKETVLNNPGAAKEQLLTLLTDSVKLRMISDVPFGTFLSGGIDSSLITSIAQKNSKEKIKTFTIGFKEESFNEAGHADKIASHLHTDHHEFIVTYHEARILLEEALDIFDEPFADSSCIPTMLLSKWTRQHVTMVLTGDGGDELFMGYGMYHWARLLDSPMIQLGKKPIASALALMGGKYRRASSLFKFSSEQNRQQHIFSQAPLFFTEHEIMTLMTANKSLPSLPLFTKNVSKKLSAAEIQSFFDLEYYLKDDLLVKVDRASMKYSLECRTPFLDYRLVEFAMNLSEGLKMSRKELKILPTRLLKDLLPAELFSHPKKGFSIPLSYWLQAEWSHLIDDYLSEEKIKKHGIVNAAVVNEIIKKFRSGQVYLYNRLWNLIVLHRWLDKNL